MNLINTILNKIANISAKKINSSELILVILLIIVISIITKNSLFIIVCFLILFAYVLNIRITQKVENFNGLDETSQYLNHDIYDMGEEIPPIPINSDIEQINNNMEIKTHIDYFMDTDALFEKKKRTTTIPYNNT